MVAGHGIMYEGGQALVINEFDPKREFYKLLKIEAWIRVTAKHYANTYFVGIFACCR